MDFDEYLSQARDTAIYPREKALEYLALGLCSEAGEVAGKVKKQIRDGFVNGMPQELGDVLWYLVMLVDEWGLSMDEVAQENLAKLRDRQERGELQGSGDQR